MYMVFVENFIKMEIGFSLRVGKKVILGKFIVVYIYDVCSQYNFSYIIGFFIKVKGFIFFFRIKQKSIYILL